MKLVAEKSNSVGSKVLFVITVSPLLIINPLEEMLLILVGALLSFEIIA